MKSRGFTLLELLTAITIFSIFAVLAYGGLAAVLKTRTRVEESMARTTAFQQALFRLQSDIEQLQPRPIRDEYGDAQPALQVNDEGLLELTRGGWRNPRLVNRSALQRVAFGIKDKQLLRYSWQTLDRAQGDVLVETVLLERVRSLSWRFLDSQREWQSGWPPARGGEERAQALPLAVELLLDTEDWGEIRYLFRIVAAGN